MVAGNTSASDSNLRLKTATKEKTTRKSLTKQRMLQVGREVNNASFVRESQDAQQLQILAPPSNSCHHQDMSSTNQKNDLPEEVFGFTTSTRVSEPPHQVLLSYADGAIVAITLQMRTTNSATTGSAYGTECSSKNGVINVGTVPQRIHLVFDEGSVIEFVPARVLPFLVSETDNGKKSHVRWRNSKFALMDVKKDFFHVSFVRFMFSKDYSSKECPELDCNPQSDCIVLYADCTRIWM